MIKPYNIILKEKINNNLPLLSVIYPIIYNAWISSKIKEFDSKSGRTDSMVSDRYSRISRNAMQNKLSRNSGGDGYKSREISARVSTIGTRKSPKRNVTTTENKGRSYTLAELNFSEEEKISRFNSLDVDKNLRKVGQNEFEKMFSPKASPMTRSVLNSKSSENDERRSSIAEKSLLSVDPIDYAIENYQKRKDTVYFPSIKTSIAVDNDEFIINDNKIVIRKLSLHPNLSKLLRTDSISESRKSMLRTSDSIKLPEVSAIEIKENINDMSRMSSPAYRKNLSKRQSRLSVESRKNSRVSFIDRRGFNQLIRSPLSSDQKKKSKLDKEQISEKSSITNEVSLKFNYPNDMCRKITKQGLISFRKASVLLDRVDENSEAEFYQYFNLDS